MSLTKWAPRFNISKVMLFVFSRDIQSTDTMVFTLSSMDRWSLRANNNLGCVEEFAHCVTNRTRRKGLQTISMTLSRVDCPGVFCRICAQEPITTVFRTAVVADIWIRTWTVYLDVQFKVISWASTDHVLTNSELCGSSWPTAVLCMCAPENAPLIQRLFLFIVHELTILL